MRRCVRVIIEGNMQSVFSLSEELVGASSSSLLRALRENPFLHRLYSHTQFIMSEDAESWKANTLVVALEVRHLRC